jgi:tape measure domain-containing protein
VADTDLQLVVRAIDEASATLEKVRAEVAGTASSAKADLDKIGAASEANKVHVSSLGAEIARIGAIVGIGLITKQFTEFGFSSASALQTTSTNMQLLIDNTTQANKVMGDLYNFSRGTPFAFPEVANAAKILLQYGDTAQTVVGTVQQLGNVVAVTGANYTRLAEIYGEVNAAGKIQMNNVQDLVQNGVPIMQAMATVTGTSIAKISEAMQQGGVSANVFNAAMQHIAPPDALNQMANTLPTQLSALQGSLRAVAFAILGINIDPIKGFVVQAGGLFDQVSNAVAALARRLRDPDVQSAMVQLGQSISIIASTVLPVLFGALTLVGQHLNELIPVLIGVAVAFASVKVIGLVEGLIALVPWLYTTATAAVTLEGALGVVGLVMGLLAGGAMYAMMQQTNSVASGMGNATKAVNTHSQALQANQEQTGRTAKAQRDLADKLADLADQVLKTNRDFNDSLANIVKSHEEKIATITDQINTEKTDFAKAQQDKTDTFKQSQAEQLDAHQRKVQDLQKQIDREVLSGRFANFQRVQDLKDSLADENRQYEATTAKNLAQYKKDTDNAKEASDDKLGKLTTQLQAETNFMQKHAADLQGIRSADALDEIAKLKQSHADQLKQYQKQRDDVVANGNAQTLGLGKAMAPLPAMAADIGKQMGSQMASQFKDGFKNSISNLWDWWYDWVHKNWDPWINNFGKSISNAIGGGGSAMVGPVLANALKALHVPGFAMGGVVPGPVGAPMLAMVHGGEVVTPPGERFGGNSNSLGAPTFNNTFHILMS